MVMGNAELFHCRAANYNRSCSMVAEPETTKEEEESCFLRGEEW